MTRFYINPETGIVDGARYVESPNQDERGDKCRARNQDVLDLRAPALQKACIRGRRDGGRINRIGRLRGHDVAPMTPSTR